MPRFVTLTLGPPAMKTTTHVVNVGAWLSSTRGQLRSPIVSEADTRGCCHEHHEEDPDRNCVHRPSGRCRLRPGQGPGSWQGQGPGRPGSGRGSGRDEGLIQPHEALERPAQAGLFFSSAPVSEAATRSSAGARRRSPIEVRREHLGPERQGANQFGKSATGLRKPSRRVARFSDAAQRCKFGAPFEFRPAMASSRLLTGRIDL
jgi:hypothetical protein